MGIGKKIAEARKRMGLSQAEFAERVGVSFSSQRRYENETRTPDTAYLDALHSIGIDVISILDKPINPVLKMAIDEASESFRAGQGTERVFFSALKIAPADWSKVVDRVVNRNYQGAMTINCDDPAWAREIANVSGLIQSYKDEAAQLDSYLLAEILEGVDLVLSAQGKALKPAKKAQTVTMLYRVFKASGKVDTAMIEEAVRLAST